MPPSDAPAWLLHLRLQVGRRIMAARLAQGLSQEDLAEMADLSRHTVYRAETGSHGTSTDAILRIAVALRVSPSSLFPTERS
ncbi:helix-turn-helix transcriptional regulator [Kitasatospora sp. NPDC048239]|uniref:helix-turn-helix transcriptional regulator n=1 Tax=Kitasatospora sp. NPDC048239 TaxID=3364046 RepID=UPI00371AE9E2